MNQQHFNMKAVIWDENTIRAKLITDIFNSIKNTIPLRQDMKVLDFGCGTGALAMHLVPHVASITGADTSKGMLDVLNNKLAEQGINTVSLIQVAPEEYNMLRGPYDLIVSTMTLHHIENISSLLSSFHSLLTPGGILAIADLDSEGGLFHGDNAEVFHNGFDRDALAKQFEAAGFQEVRHTTSGEVTKPDANNEMRTFSLFLITGQKL